MGGKWPNMVTVAKINKTDRDEKGRFVEGNLVSLEKGLWARKHKIIDCDSCYINDRCEFNQSGALCAFKRAIVKKYKIRDVSKLINLMWDELEDIDRRLEVAKWYEVKDGGVLDRSIDRLLATKINLMRYLGELLQVPQVIEAMKEQESKQVWLQKVTYIYNLVMEEERKKQEEELKKRLVERLSEEGNKEK